MSTIATICARGGSTGVPRKNLKPLLGRPLVVHSIGQALACPRLDRVFVSTDDPEIASVAKGAGAEVPFLRPAELATDNAPKLPAIQNLVENIERLGVNVDRIVDLDPTSPLRSLSDIDACLDLLDTETDVVITTYRSEKNPYFNMVEIKPDGSIRPVKLTASSVTSRQLAPPVYAMNASIYVWHRHSLNKGLWQGRVRMHVMPRERSIDIDTELDFLLVEMLMRKIADSQIQS